jgi:hypothetical protein
MPTSNRKSAIQGAALGMALTAMQLAMPAHAQSMSPRVDTTQAAMNARDLIYDINNRPATEGSLRPEVAVPLQEALRMMNNMEPVGAAEKIAKAEKIEEKSPYELHVIARVKSKLAIAKGQPDEAAKQYLVAAEGKWLSPADRVAELEVIASLYYHKKDYPQAARWFDRYAEAGGTNANSGMLRAQSHYLIDDYHSTAKVLDTELGRTLAASQKPPEMMLKLLLDSKERINDVDGSKKAAQLLAQYYPGKAD